MTAHISKDPLHGVTEVLYLDSLDDAVPVKQDEPAINPWANSRLNKS